MFFEKVSTEGDVRKCSANYVFLKILQNLEKNNCVGISFLIKFKGLGLQLYLKRGTSIGDFLLVLKNI